MNADFTHYSTILIIEPSSQVLVNGFAGVTSWFVAAFVYHRYFLERILPRIYKSVWTRMDIRDQRSFTVHHYWLTVKFLMLPGAWPYINIMFRGQAIDKPLFSGTNITNADFLSTLYMGIIASFCWEICYRISISPVSLIHHVAAICLASWQIAGDVQSVPYSSVVPANGQFLSTVLNDQQFKLIMTYGVFEVVFESWMHACCILHKLFAGQHMKTSRLWGIGGIWVLIGSLIELSVMAVLWHAFWYAWDVPTKVIMVVLHFAFMAAQLHGARIGFTLMRKYRHKALVQARENDPASDPEASGAVDGTEKPRSVSVGTEEQTLAGLAIATLDKQGLAEVDGGAESASASGSGSGSEEEKEEVVGGGEIRQRMGGEDKRQ